MSGAWQVWLAALVAVLSGHFLGKYLFWALERLSFTDTRVGRWLHERDRKRRPRRWVRLGYKPHMDDKR